MRWHRQDRPPANHTGPESTHGVADSCHRKLFEIEGEPAVLEHRAEFRIAPARCGSTADGVDRQYGYIREKPRREIHGR